MKRIALVVTHGMGSPDRSFADGLKRRLTRSLEGRGFDAASVVWCPVLWSDLVEKRQQDFLAAAVSAGPLSRVFGLREFVVSALGDAAGYRHHGNDPGSTYYRIHQRIREKIHTLFEDGLGSEPVPMIVVAHSMGGHVMSNYIWDSQSLHTTGASADAHAFERMEWLAAIVTFGCNIPLFTFAYEPVEPICFPGTALPEDLRSKAVWRNFYDRHDVLGYPLKPLGRDTPDLPALPCDQDRQHRPRYEDIVEDVEVNVGLPLVSATPLSHTKYWHDRSFVNGLADVVALFL